MRLVRGIERPRKATAYSRHRRNAREVARRRGLTPRHLDIPYREGGWTIRQIVHHIPESHLNSYVRFKLALTEDQPTITAVGA